MKWQFSPSWYKVWQWAPWYHWSITQYNNFVYCDNYVGIGPLQFYWRSGYLELEDFS